ncbi:hypothetical protein B0T26DRAFT_741849 [Lasiosphaeria miniovina]|uniref:Uncharacterized protein n=1 Tax=Lasiosphaeria miniovina TaxID=1954250 RepID=A0AA40AC40_9PEZI|nr:uncharacterized protein B0T26DRAFT_741849 [Lasiosphaeria miniovina]KAK0712975.1 hypothetical protein B0T26DRAFT_741849 [Lasiosphaeria miniovina]
MSQPTLINLPPPSNPDTPSEMPGTPTSTTTSLSALSTTAIKDGHRGYAHAMGGRGHHHSVSANSLEAERADRISRLAGLSTVSGVRGPPAGGVTGNHNADSPQTTPTSTGFPVMNHTAAPGGLTPAFFDATGQPVAATKMSTVGTASATESVGGRTSATETAGDDRYDTLGERDEDMLSMDTNDDEDGETAEERGMDSASTSGYTGGTGDGADADVMDEDLENLGTRSSVGGFEDRMSDDGSVSLVGFGEGAGSTVSGPIYHRRPLPLGQQSSAGAMAGIWSAGIGALERSSSGLSDSGAAAAARKDTGSEREVAGGVETPVSQSAVAERQEARMVDGVALDGAGRTVAREVNGIGDDDVFVDTTTRGPVPVQPAISAIRETQQPNSHQQISQAQYLSAAVATAAAAATIATTATTTDATYTSNSLREAAERIVRERLDEGEARVGRTALGSPKGTESLARFYFEER